MYQHVLVTLDGSDTSEAVVAHALRLRAARFTLLRVLDSTPAVVMAERGGGKPVSLLDPRSAYHEQARHYLDRVAARFRTAGVAAEPLIRTGPPAHRIVETADELGVDAIALCTHGRTGLRKILVGSVAAEVLEKTRLPVLLVR
jgi:nucleotide-binding universal stress UspA family protein